MRRLVIAPLGLAAAIAVAACGGGAASSTPASTPAGLPGASPTAGAPTASAPAGSPAAGSPAASPAAGSTAVTIANFAFNPASATVAVGASVTWTNTDSATHVVAWDDGTTGSGNLTAGGQTYTRTFATAGTFTYHCAIHPSMKGTVVVGP